LNVCEHVDGRQSEFCTHPPHEVLHDEVTAVVPVVHESVASLQLEMKPAKKSHVLGLLSGLFVQVPIEGRLFPEQDTAVPAVHPEIPEHTSFPLQYNESEHKAFPPLSTVPSQLSSMPLQVSDVGVPATALQTTPLFCALQTYVPVLWQAPVPTVQDCPSWAPQFAALIAMILEYDPIVFTLSTAAR